MGIGDGPAALLDERGSLDFRGVFGDLARRSSEIRVAVTRIRLSTVDLTAVELARLRELRVVISEMNALSLDAEARTLRHHPRRAPNLVFMTDLLNEGRLQLRSSPLAGWAPDFTVFSRDLGAFAVLVGPHWFERPYPHRGPAFVSVHQGDAARMAARRFDELWTEAHDIGSAAWSILHRARPPQVALRATGG